MLSFEVRPDGGVVIAGTETDLLALVNWLRLAVSRGHVAPSYVADQGLTTIEIIRRDSPVLTGEPEPGDG